MIYHFPQGFIPALVSHRNAKEKKPFHLTWPSTLDEIKRESKHQGPKATVICLSSTVGGVARASAPGQLPQDEMRMTNVQRNMKGKERGSGSNADADDLFVILQ